jgi:hypothetical protein
MDLRHILSTYLSARQSVSPGQVNLVLCPATSPLGQSASVVSITLGTASVAEQAECPQRPGAATFSPGTLLIRFIRQSSDTVVLEAELYRATHPTSWTERFVWPSYPTPGEWRLSFGEFAPVH